MNTEEFAVLCRQVRDAQKRFFRTRKSQPELAKQVLEECVKLEKQLDAELASQPKTKCPLRIQARGTREAQKHFFRTRHPMDLRVSRNAEGHLDRLVEQTLNPYRQTTMFEETPDASH